MILVMLIQTLLVMMSQQTISSLISCVNVVWKLDFHSIVVNQIYYRRQRIRLHLHLLLHLHLRLHLHLHHPRLRHQIQIRACKITTGSLAPHPPRELTLSRKASAGVFYLIDNEPSTSSSSSSSSVSSSSSSTPSPTSTPIDPNSLIQEQINDKMNDVEQKKKGEKKEGKEKES